MMSGLVVVVLVLVAMAQSGLGARALISERELETRIVGGDLMKEQVTWIASMQRKSGGELKTFCGATVISDRYLITAAHCMKYGVAPERIIIGRNDLNGNGGVVLTKNDYTVKQHEGYWYLDNDIGLIKLKKPLPSWVTPISLNFDLDSELEKAGNKACVIGWGYTYYGKREVETKLRKVCLPLISNAQCKNADHEVYEERIYDGNLCMGEKGKDSCSGDSGGPQYAIDQSGKPVLIGVVSWGKGCADGVKAPGVYSRISYFKDWIVKNTNLGKNDGHTIEDEDEVEEEQPPAEEEEEEEEDDDDDDEFIPSPHETRSPTIQTCMDYKDDKDACVADWSCRWNGPNKNFPCVKKIKYRDADEFENTAYDELENTSINEETVPPTNNSTDGTNKFIAIYATVATVLFLALVVGLCFWGRKFREASVNVDSTSNSSQDKPTIATSAPPQEAIQIV